MDRKNKISSEQIKCLIVTIVIGVGILSLPSDMAMILDNDGWMGILLGGLITIPFIIMIDKIFKLYPDKNFFQLGKEIMNPIIFKIILIILLSYNILLLSLSVRIFSDVIKTYLLETTPIEIIIITMLLAVSYIARSQIEVIARMAVMIYPIILGFIIFLIIINIPNMDITNIYPIFNIDYKLLPRGVLKALFSYAGYELIMLFVPIAEDSQKTLRCTLKGISLVIGIYLIAFFITLSQYGIHQLKREIWPTIAVVKEVDLPGYFLENLDGIVMAAWVMVVYGTMGPFLHSSGVILSNILNTREHESLIFPILPIIYILAIYPKNLVQVEEIVGKIFNYLSLFAIMFIPAILFILAMIKKRRNS